MVYTVLCLTVRKPGMSFDDYKSYYENTHSKTACRLLGPTEPETYVRNYVDREKKSANTTTIFITGSADDFDYDCVTVMTWRDEAAFMEMVERFKDPDVAKGFAEDEEKFIDRGKTKLIAVGESPFSLKST